MLARIEIPGTFPSLNEYIEANRASARGGNAVKHKATERIRAACVASGAPCFGGAVDVCILWVEESRRRDWDNVTYAAKFILDGLKEAWTIPDDNQTWIPAPILNAGAHDKTNPRAVVFIADHDPRTLNLETFGSALRRELGFIPWRNAGKL